MENIRTDMSCARIKTYTASKIGAAERHCERKNNDYGNVNVVPERIPFNIHFKDPGEKSYMDILREKEQNGEVSERGLRTDAVLFDEAVFDVNTMYFEEHGGYEYAKKFYEETYRYVCNKYGEQNIISAVMHADEINKAATESMGKPIYHYHMHVIALPVVDKEIRWSKRCRDPKLVGTVKEVVHQISHSKKWESREPLTDENGTPILRKNGKPKFRPSYSVLQDEFYKHMTEHGFDGFTRGREGSNEAHLTSLQYQIEKDKERLAGIEKRYECAVEVNKTCEEIDAAGKKNITGKYTVSKDDYDKLTALAKEGITSRNEISRLKGNVNYYKERAFRYNNALNSLQEKYDKLVELCRPFLDALEHFPDTVRKFADKVAELFTAKDKEEKAEAERRRAEEERLRIERKKKAKDRGGAR